MHALPGEVLVTTISASFTIDATLETFEQDVFKISLATVIGVAPSAITLLIAGGSIIVTAQVATTNAEDAATAKETIEFFVARPALASSFLGVTVLDVGMPTSETTFVMLSPPAPAASPPAVEPLAEPAEPRDYMIAAVPVSLILMFMIFAAIFFAVRYAMCPINCDSPTVVEVKSAPVSEIATSSRTADEVTPGTSVKSSRTADVDFKIGMASSAINEDDVGADVGGDVSAEAAEPIQADEKV